MSGLLRRLAARALGAAPEVRPVLGWPGTPMEMPVRAPAPATAPQASLGPEPDESPPHRSPAARAAPPGVVQPSAPPSDPLAGPLAATTESRAESDDEPAPRPLAPRPPTSARRSAPRAVENRIEVSVEAPAQTLRPREPALDPLPDAPQLLPPRRMDRTLPLPAIAAPAVAARTVAARRPAAIDEPAEVHVTIGRIEVTAVHEAPPPRRQPARVRKPKSLEEHLAQRQGRRG